MRSLSSSGTPKDLAESDKRARCFGVSQHDNLRKEPSPMNQTTITDARSRAASMLADAGIVLTSAEATNIEIADLGLGRLETEGLEIVTYENNDRYCAKE